MNILFAASEAVPLAKTGGLADVVGALPKALRQCGADVRVILPMYGEIPDAARMIGAANVRRGRKKLPFRIMEIEARGIRFYLIEHEYYFRRGSLNGYEDEAERFVFYCFAVLESLSVLDFAPDLIHCHDWQTGLIPYLLKTKYAQAAIRKRMKTVFTIHNLKYQGDLSDLSAFSQELLKILPGTEVNSGFGTGDTPLCGILSCMEAGLHHADKLTTVSPSYAVEIQTAEYGEGLDELLRQRSCDLQGILNGIDTSLFDPATDPVDPAQADREDGLALKKANKAALQRELGLPELSGVPLIGMVARLVQQKGFDLLEEALESLLCEPLQLVVLGEGEPYVEAMLALAAMRYPHKMSVRIGFDDRLARRIYAGSDLYLMPSSFEPCGLSQMIALRYRSIPIVRETGGLKDTVFAYNEDTGEGNGFSFARYHAHDMVLAIQKALALYGRQQEWETIVRNAAKADFSWNQSAKSYMKLYGELLKT